jgi:phosphoketolase
MSKGVVFTGRWMPSTACGDCAISARHLRQILSDRLQEYRAYICRHGEDMPEIRDWQWTRNPAIFDIVPP